MDATPAATFVKKSVGWSIALSLLMILAGVLAIGSPMAAGIAINVLVAWLLVFSAGAHLVFAWFRRSAGGFLWELLVGILYIHRCISAEESGCRSGVTDDCFGYISACGGDPGICLGIHTAPASGVGFAPRRWGHHSHPGDHDLEDLAVEHGLGDRHTGWSQHAI